jgi:hypothetical protein
MVVADSCTVQYQIILATATIIVSMSLQQHPVCTLGMLCEESSSMCQLQNMHQNREKNYVVDASSVFEPSQIIIVHNVFSFFSSSASSARREPHIASSDSCVFLLHRSSVTRLFNSFPIIFSSTSSES